MQADEAHAARTSVGATVAHLLRVSFRVVSLVVNGALRALRDQEPHQLQATETRRGVQRRNAILCRLVDQRSTL